MPATVTESIESRRTSSTGRNSSHVRKYFVEGVDDDNDAITEALAIAPTSYTVQGVVCNTREAVATYVENEYEVEVTWKPPTSDSSKQNNQSSLPTEQTMGISDDPLVTFTVSGETAMQFEALEQYEIVGGMSVANADIGNRINYDGETVQGVEVLYPYAKYQLTKVYNPATITDAWVKARIDLYATINDATYRGVFDAHTLRFDELNISERDDGLVIVTFGWSYRPTKSVTIAGETFDKPGWFYTWVRYEEQTAAVAGADHVRLIPKNVMMARNYPIADHSSIV